MTDEEDDGDNLPCIADQRYSNTSNGVLYTGQQIRDIDKDCYRAARWHVIDNEQYVTLYTAVKPVTFKRLR